MKCGSLKFLLVTAVMVMVSRNEGKKLILGSNIKTNKTIKYVGRNENEISCDVSIYTVS